MTKKSTTKKTSKKKTVAPVEEPEVEATAVVEEATDVEKEEEAEKAVEPVVCEEAEECKPQDEEIPAEAAEKVEDDVENSQCEDGVESDECNIAEEETPAIKESKNGPKKALNKDERTISLKEFLKEKRRIFIDRDRR